MDRDAFLSDLGKVLKKHRVWLDGTMKIRNMADWKETSRSCLIEDERIVWVGLHKSRDTVGPFLTLSIDKKEEISIPHASKVNTVIMDKDKLLVNGIKSPITNEAFHNRLEWNNHLKANNCVEFGNDLNNAKMRSDVRGDFDCRKELTEAVNQVIR